MRVTFVAPFGGCRKQTVPRRILPLAQALSARGFHIQVVIPAWDCPDDETVSLIEGQVVIDQFSSARYFPTQFDVGLQAKMIGVVRSFQPTLLHVFKAFGYSGAMAQLLKKRLPVVVDLDDLDTSAGWGQQRRRATRSVIDWQHRSVLASVNGLTVASRYLERIHDGIAKPIIYLPNATNPSSKPLQVGANTRRVLLYTRGNDIEAADVSRLWPEILQQAPDAELVIVGDWAKAPVLPRCHHLGWLSGAALMVELQKAAVAWFPVKDTPLVCAKSPARLLDCMGLGLPVLTRDVGEYGGVLKSAGIEVPANDTEMVAMAAMLLQDTAARVNWGSACWRYACTQTWGKRAEQLAIWYDHILER